MTTERCAARDGRLSILDVDPRQLRERRGGEGRRRSSRFGADGRSAARHGAAGALSIVDKTGAAVVVEPIGGKLVIYDDPLGVITNSPTFDWHMTNLGNYVGLSPEIARRSPCRARRSITSAKVRDSTAFRAILRRRRDSCAPSRTSRRPSSLRPETTPCNRSSIFSTTSYPARRRARSSQRQDHRRVDALDAADDLTNLEFDFRTFNDQSLRSVDVRKSAGRCRFDDRVSPDGDRAGRRRLRPSRPDRKNPKASETKPAKGPFNSHAMGFFRSRAGALHRIGPALASCGSLPTASSGGAAPASVAPHAAHGSLLYLSNVQDHDVEIYSYPDGRTVGKLSNFGQPPANAPTRGATFGSSIRKRCRSKSMRTAARRRWWRSARPASPAAVP